MTVKLFAGGEGIAVTGDRVGGLHVQHPDVVPAQLAAEPRAAENVDRLAAGEADPAREEQVDRLGLAELEDLGVLEEERTLLGKEKAEARQVDLLLVGFDLREVGVDREVQRQVGADAPLEVDADVAGAVDRIGAQRPVVVGRARDVGRGLHVPPGREAEAVQLAGDRDAMERVAAGHRRQEDLLILPPDNPHDVDPPDAVLARGIAQGLERDLELGLPSARGGLGADGEVGVPVRVESA